MAPDLPARRLFGALALSPALPEARLREVFAEQFGRAPEAGTGELRVTASHAVEGRQASLWSRDRPVFWDSRREEYVRIDGPTALDAIAPLVRAGVAWPALDDCVVLLDREGVLLFASGAGAATLYHVESDGTLLFADRPQSIRASRDAPVDRLGLGEIVRFGANYGRRTLLQGVHRLPIGHVLDCAAGRPAVQRAFVDFSYRPC